MLRRRLQRVDPLRCAVIYGERRRRSGRTASPRRRCRVFGVAAGWDPDTQTSSLSPPSAPALGCPLPQRRCHSPASFRRRHASARRPRRCRHLTPPHPAIGQA
eukprot:354296-Chlamydomonas_euryale.AAC.7